MFCSDFMQRINRNISCRLRGITMKNGDRPAMPIECEIIDASGNFMGLTKREHFAGLAMAAMIPICNKWDNDPQATLHTVAAMASVMYADALLKELEK